MTCKDCIHYERCKRILLHWTLKLDTAIGTCTDFKDKATVIELPCKVSDTVYCIDYNLSGAPKGIKEFQVSEIGINDEGITIYDFDGIDYALENVYFTKEEAEKALEELANENRAH